MRGLVGVFTGDERYKSTSPVRTTYHTSRAVLLSLVNFRCVLVFVTDAACKERVYLLLNSVESLS